MILRFAGSAAEIFAKFREIEDRCAALERQPIAQADLNRAPPAREDTLMQTIRSFSGIALALAIGYAAGVLMCVDAYYLGQSSVAKGGLTGPSMICLPRRQGPVDTNSPYASAETATTTFPVNGTEVCQTLPSEHTP